MVVFQFVMWSGLPGRVPSGVISWMFGKSPWPSRGGVANVREHHRLLFRVGVFTRGQPEMNPGACEDNLTKAVIMGFNGI